MLSIFNVLPRLLPSQNKMTAEHVDVIILIIHIYALHLISQRAFQINIAF